MRFKPKPLPDHWLWGGRVVEPYSRAALLGVVPVACYMAAILGLGLLAVEVLV